MKRIPLKRAARAVVCSTLPGAARHLSQRLRRLCGWPVFLVALFLLLGKNIAQAELFKGLRYTVSPDRTITIRGFNCASREAVIPDHIEGMPVTDIGNEAFSGCKRLSRLTIPSGVRSIGEGAFQGTGLIQITIPGSVVSIPKNAFFGCEDLVHVSLLNGVTRIEESGFAGCGSLSTVTIPESVRHIGSLAFLGSGLTSVTIPGGVATISKDAFRECNKLAEVSILGGVVKIDAFAFFNCRALKRVTLPDSVTQIGTAAFGTTGLTNITLGNRITRIESMAFGWCEELTSVYCLGNAPKEEVDVFFAAMNATVYYLPGTRGWGSRFGSRPTAAWNLPHPVILSTAPQLGMTANGFGFTISWATNATVVVEASADPTSSTWSLIGTHTIRYTPGSANASNGWAFFNDPESRSQPARFYRVRAE